MTYLELCQETNREYKRQWCRENPELVQAQTRRAYLRLKADPEKLDDADLLRAALRYLER